MIRLRSLPMLAGLVLLWCDTGALAQSTPEASYSPATQAGVDSSSSTGGDPLVVKATGDPDNRIGQPMFVTVVLKNTSAIDLELKSLNIKIDAVSADRFIDPMCPIQQRGEIRIDKGLSYQQTCRFDMHPTRFQDGFLSWQRALLNADIRLSITALPVSLGSAPKDRKELGTYHYFPSVPIRASEVSIFLGGMVGAMMLAVFVWIEQILKSPRTRGAWLRTFSKSFVTMALMGFRGGLMAIIALLLGQTTQGPGSPVNLTVTDFTGGILVGLFSYPLAAWVASTLKIESLAHGKGPKRKDASAGTPPEE